MIHIFFKPFRTGLLGALILGLSVCLASAEPDLSPKEIVHKADQARGNTQGVEWQIHIKSIERGREQQRTLRVRARRFDSLAEFLAPPNVKGQKILMLDRNMWFAKPGLSKPVPISPRQKLIGGASNGDIASTNYAEDYDIEKMTQEMVNGENCYCLELKASDNKATYDRIRYWVSETRLVGVRADFFTVSGKLFKSAEFEYNNRISIDGNPREFISRMVITSALIKNDVTTMDYGQVLIRAIPDSVFNLNLLTQ
jgi:hypothetical protein